MRISGTIVDINNEPLSRANIVMITGDRPNKVGTITNFDGKFDFEREDINDDSVFAISYIGFIRQELKAKDLQNQTIVLKESIDVFDEVILVGIKPTPKEDIKPIIQQHFRKNKYLYTGLAGGLGILLIGLSIKKL